MNINNLDKKLENANTLSKLSTVFEEINKSLNSSCNNIYNLLFDYKFSNYLYTEYIIKNKTKVEIANKLGISPSSVFYYIQKYNLKKSNKKRQEKMLTTMQITCQKKYNVNHPGEIKSSHRKRINNILKKTKNNYSSECYPKLKKSITTKNKMSISQQYRRKNEKLGD